MKILIEDDVLTDLSASKWLKDQIITTKYTDNVDLLNDIDVLKIIIEERHRSQSI